MLVSALALSVAVLGQQDAKPVTLNRVFTKGEKMQYDVKSNLHIQARQYGLTTFMPDDLDLAYKFTSEVKELKADGIAVVHYQRPTMTEVQGEDADSGSKTKVTKTDMIFDLTVSPINEILEMKDLTPKKPKKAGDGGLLFAASRGKQNPLSGMLGQFVSELYRLALNVGSLDAAVDFSPKLPLDEVKVGDTWKKTVGYEPQKLKGKDGKQAVQRLDYTFTYKGMVTINGKQFYRINAALDLNADAGAFINQLMDAKPEDTHLKSIPLVLKQSIDYDLDMATKRTVAAHSKAEGSFKINITDVPDEPVVEEKINGSTEMRLISLGTATPAKAKTGGSKGH
jgi:hypothetical protein